MHAYYGKDIVLVKYLYFVRKNNNNLRVGFPAGLSKHFRKKRVILLLL